MRIRTAQVSDAAAIAGFQLAMARETENRALNAATVKAGVEHCLRDARLGTYYVAELDGVVVGCMLITFEWSDWRNGLFWWIQSVYVVPAHRGQGVYAVLHRWVEELARSTPGVCGLRLYVDLENQHAQRVYASLGMSRCNYALYEADWPIASAT